MGLLIGLIFYHFSKSYQRRFLSSWSYSWFAFAVYMLGSFLITEQIARQIPNRTFYSGLCQISAFLHVFFLLRGTLEFLKGKPLRRSTTYITLGILIILAVASVLLWYDNPEGATQRYLLRYGMRTFVSSAGFLLATWLVFSNRLFHRGFAQKMLAFFFLLYGLCQAYYFLIIVLNALSIRFQIPSFFGLLDLTLIACVGMSMIIWLLENEREKLRRTNQELDSFLYSTSHDLRAPIASILGLTSLSKFEVQDEEAKKLFGMIEDRARKMDLVIEDILLVAKSKKRVSQIDRIDFSSFLKNLLEEIKFTEGASSIRFIYENNQNYLHSDAAQLKIILGNLLSNAIKYHNPDQENPFIKITFIKDEENVRISVEDNGKGIPAQSQSRVFEMFFRATLQGNGTGLGLYISKEAVLRLGGDITFQSEENRGSLFTINLPLLPTS